MVTFKWKNIILILSVIHFSCQGKPQCNVTAAYGSMNIDPCSGYLKYLEINYTCAQSKKI